MTATGSLHAISEQKLGFPEGGRLTELDVSVGDRVTAGQVLAKTDNTAQQMALRKAKDQVVKEQASLDQIKAGNQVDGANAELAWRRDMLAAVQETAVQTDRSDAAEIDQAERVLEFDRSELIRQLKRLEVTQERCDKSKVLGTSATAETSVDTGAQTGNAKAQTSHCDHVEDRRNDVAKVKHDVVKDEGDVDKARKKRDLDRPAQQSKIDDAKHDLTEDENKVGLASTDRHYTIEKQQAALDQANADVVIAQHALDATIMHSSFSGIVDHINGGVGQVLDASYNTASLTAGSGDQASARQSSARQPGDSALIVLNNVNSFRMMLPFSQADVAGMQPNQPAEVSFDAIPGLTRKAIVASIEPTQAVMGGDANYLVTVVLTELDPSLRDGMTGQAHVITSTIDNVLVVPTAAVRRHGRTGTVSVLQSDGTQRDVSVQLGSVGKETSQVVSGLREGDQVVLAAIE
ncbi:MAG: efflux RND transporter periplasmic adaptor subunit [Pseudonocardiaceae bacterium]